MCECELDAAGYGIFNIERIERDYPHVYGIFELCGRYARGFSFVAWLELCGRYARGFSFVAW